MSIKSGTRRRIRSVGSARLCLHNTPTCSVNFYYKNFHFQAPLRRLAGPAFWESDISNSICTVFFGHWGEEDKQTKMVVVPLTSCVINGQIKWRLVSERRSESGNKGGNFSQKTPSIHKGGESHKGEKSHKCNNCSYSTSLEHNLRTHMRRHNSEKLSKCDQCNYEWNQKVILQIHVRNVHNDLWYRCDNCDYKASQKSNLKTHTQIKHEGMMYYGCDQCSFRARKKQKLDEHMQKNVHTKIKHNGIQMWPM